MTRRPEWDEEVDVLIAGSGAGALMSAITAADRGAKVLVVEKSSEYGGTSATSGGGIWIPNSHLGAAAGLKDSPEEAFRYLRALSSPNVPDENIRAFVRYAPEMLEVMVTRTPVRYASLPYPDYHADIPGGKAGFRTHLPLEINGRLLGPDMATLRQASPAASLFGRINWRFTETYTLLFRPKGWLLTAIRMFLRYYGDLAQRMQSPKDRFLTLGTALVGGLRLALNQRKVPLWLNSPLKSLVTDTGAVLGAVVERNGVPLRIRARQGVVLAAGGFERNAAWRRTHLVQPDPRLSGSQENNTGDTLQAAIDVGAATLNLHSAWWATVFSIPGEARARLSTIERALPGSLMVNQAGRRYLNEAAAYEVVARKMLAADSPAAPTQPSWMVFDASFRWKYPVGPVMPLVPGWLHPRAVRSILKKASNLESLAEKMGVPAQNFVATVQRFNEFAERGEDPDFHRGEATYDRMYGDARVSPNPTLAPLRKPPFYAFPIYAGDIGTNGGLSTNAHAQVLDLGGSPITGLYAVGNNAASVMGESYPGAGATLGPSLTFAYVAALHMTGAFSASAEDAAAA